ncbi:hypothetical protein ACP70R_019642 [Stipagrostis hirtigluma subsp. patula]
MSKLSLGLHIFVLYAVFLAHQSQEHRIHPTSQADSSSPTVITTMKKRASNLHAMDSKVRSLDTTWSPMQTLYGTTSPSESGDGMPALFAAHNTELSENGFYGVVATMDVYGYTLNGGQMSTAAIWISNDDGDWKQNLDAITVGWTVFPSHFKDSHTHFFTHWTRDADRNTGCLNTDCPGFQLVSRSATAPGDVITHLSDANGQRQNITIKLFKDKSSGDWLLHYGFNSAPALVGHFPASLFESLSKKATQIGFGGHVRYMKTVTSPPMGSGSFPSDKAASFWDLQLIDEDGNITRVNNDLPSTVTDKTSYSVSSIEGAKFSYGGPGGHSS